MKKNKTAIIGIICLGLIVVFLSRIVNVIINIKWFKEIGYLSVYFTRIITVVALMLLVFVICFLSIKFYFKSIKNNILKHKEFIDVDLGNEKIQNRVIGILNIVISLFIAITFSTSYWDKILQFINANKFNIKDPIFNIDISFFIFKLPLIESIYSSLMSLLIILAVITVIIYVILNAKDRISFGRNYTGKIIDINNFKSGITKFAGKQLAILGALLLLCISLGYLIKAWNLSYSPRGVAFGASYTDTKVTLKFYMAISIVAIFCSIIVAISILKSKIKPIIASVVVIVILVISEGIVSGVWQKLVVKSNERRLETPFIEYNMKYTKQAFGIDNVKEKLYPLTNVLTKESIGKNKDTIENIKINSVSQALEYYNQVESKKNYYNFNDIDIDRYKINGRYNQVFIAPREIDYNKLQEKANTWQNKHLTYTHGYGVVMSKVNSVTKEGKPDFVIKDMPLVNTSGVKLDDPRVYYGEKTSEYAIVNTKLNEMDYLKDSGENASKNYDGNLGIRMSILNRILFAINEKDIKFLLSSDITSNSRILIRRNIGDRVRKIAPFLSYDSNPYIVINNGKLYWVIDAYTTSTRYPFSEPIEGTNYMRNSVKVIIDAVNGTTDFYITDKNDPVVLTYSKIFPKLFKDASNIPNGFKEHFKYPQDYFQFQCKAMERYHVSDPGTFFAGQNIWDVAKTQKQIEGKKSVNEAAYLIMKLPGEQKEEMILLQYFNQYQRENMIALFGARMDNNNYGNLVLYKFPTTKSETVNSPILFKQKIKQDTTISKELSLWDAKGSQVQFGDTMIIPVENSLLYVEPLYLRADSDRSIPEMKRVIVAYGDKIILDENIEKALHQLFNYEGKPEEIKKGNTNNIQSKSIPKEIKDAKELYDKALECQKNGNWSEYGENINKLGKLLGDLNKK
ncbi:hypothetical protein ADU90_13015 [Clostridium botulinum]|uniref:UPF0182 protein Z955_06085 n=1 Tax=Clostridium botulinum C/D str. DC5 TaxID=1443128 RepID=A0A0A0IJN0_CLOBO|nr:UPF0182 family protein [Clostridium botulinum]KEI00804.1 membrane protein [Clostridium botulinum C/D str. BKT75002]KEI09722.1 membrane protein [Clostridium botulinum C/D str. BKT2873]KGM96994.1 membrane protein [Clostridium botulinum D str. CCUG 7971]KGM99730.1 membrane protein [Clostridium botulinum C/D str. DC5]KOC48936.1 hypothetical protein ADU88_07245 [Clostridium botulinum]